jgi:tetratricopeptide (TPR) repeat protein
MIPTGRTISEEFILEKINDYLSKVRPKERGWEGKLESLKSFIFEVFEEDERDIQIKIKFFEKSIEDLKTRFSSSLSRFQEIHMEIWLGHCFERFGAWDKALSAYEKALALCDDGKYDMLKSEATRSMGHIFLMRNQWKKALDLYQESLQLSQTKGDREGEAFAYNSIGILYFEKGKLKEASSYWEKGLEQAEKLNNAKLSAQITNNLGALMSMQGNWEKALAYYAKGGTLFEQAGEYRGLAETYHNMGMTYADLQRWPESCSYYEKSYAIAKKIGDVRLQAMIKLNRVEVYISINDVYAGLALCNQALQTFIQLNDHLGEAEVYKFIGILYGRIGEWDLSRSYFNDSILLAEKYQNPLLEGEALFECGIMLKKKKEKEAAVQHFQKALALFQELNADKDIEKVNQALASKGD